MDARVFGPGSDPGIMALTMKRAMPVLPPGKIWAPTWFLQGKSNSGA